MEEHIKTGWIGEEIASRYLEERGYKILERNYTKSKLEADIIAQKGEYIVFVEVKTRNVGNFVSARNSVNKKKQINIISLANNYILYNKIDLHARFDIIAIEINENKDYSIEHIEDAYNPHSYSRRGASYGICRIKNKRK